MPLVLLMALLAQAENFKQGVAHYTARRYEAALREMKIVLKAQPNLPEANLIAGAAALKLEQACLAAGYLAKAEAMAQAPEYLEQRADAEAACGRASATSWYQRLTRVAPNNPRGWYGLGLSKLAEGSQNEATAAFARLAALGPSPELDRLERDIARALWKAGRYPEARQALERVRLSAKPEASLEYELGNTIEQLEGPEAALPSYRRAVALDPKLLPAQAALGRALMTLQKPAEAIPHLEVAAAANIDKSLWAALANAYRAVGRIEQARVALAKAR